MRQVATLPDERQARRLADHLLTLGITTRVDPSPTGNLIWVHREDRVDEAKREVDGFLADPENPRYLASPKTVAEIRREARRKEKLHARNSISLQGRLNVPSPERCPVTYVLIAISVVMAFLTGFGTNRKAMAPLLFSRGEEVIEYREVSVSPDLDGDASPMGKGTMSIPVRTFKYTGLKAVESGQVWRLVTPIFLHFGVMHLVFNMIWLHQLGCLIEMRKGRLALLGLVLGSAVISNFGQYFWEVQTSRLDPNLTFGGMSGVVYALFGYCWMKSDYEPEERMSMPSNTIVYMIAWLVLCMTGMLGPIANAAHLVGLGVGIVVGITPHLLHVWRWR